jgi:hypothetical protein
MLSLEWDFLAYRLLAPNAQVLLKTDIQQDLPVPDGQVMQLYMQVLVDVQYIPAMGAATTPLTGYLPVDGLGDLDPFCCLDFCDCRFFCYLELWNM